MGFLKNAKANTLGEVARRAAADGRMFLTPRLNFPQSMHGMSDDISDWAVMVQAIEEQGWRLEHWSVGMDTKGRPEAYPVFRRVG